MCSLQDEENHWIFFFFMIIVIPLTINDTYHCDIFDKVRLRGDINPHGHLARKKEIKGEKVASQINVFPSETKKLKEENKKNIWYIPFPVFRTCKSNFFQSPVQQ